MAEARQKRTTAGKRAEILAAAGQLDQRIGSPRPSDVLFARKGFTMRMRESIEQMKESFPFANPDAGTEFDDRYYTAVGSDGAEVDLPAEVLYTAQRLSVLLYAKNVRAFQTFRLIITYALGNGITVTANDPDVQRLLDLHLKINQWVIKSPERLRALSAFGEQIYPVTVSPDTGVVMVTSVSPFKLKRVIRDQDDGERLDALSMVIGQKPVTFRIIQPSRENGNLFAMDDAAPGRPSAAFFLAVNRISGGTRGIPDLFASVDWLEGLDGFLWSMLERAHTSSEVVHDLEIEGANETEVNKFVATFASSLKGGGIYGHNEKVKHAIKGPNMGAFEADSIASLFLKQIQSGTGLAGLFFGDSADLTRSSAGELTAPVAKIIQDRQNFWRESQKQIFNYQIEAAIALKKLRADVDRSFSISMPRVFLRDVTTVTKGVSELSQALTLAVENNWIDNQEAGKVFRAVLEELGNVVQSPAEAGE